MRRRSELCSLRFEDISVYPNGQYYILLRFSKTDQFGEGSKIPISNHLVKLIKCWQKKRGAASGYILRSVDKGGNVGPNLHPASIPRLLRDVQDRAYGFRRDMPDLSDHSFRVGAALDMLDQGTRQPSVCLQSVDMSS